LCCRQADIDGNNQLDLTELTDAIARQTRQHIIVSYPGTDFKESIPPAYLACRAGTSNRVVVPVRQAGNRFLGSLEGLKIRALVSGFNSCYDVWE
jgi:hypothetical protein